MSGPIRSELLLAGLSCSFILASGVVKDVGRWLMGEHGVPEFWMPFATGLVFLVPFVVSALLLARYHFQLDAVELLRAARSVPLEARCSSARTRT